MALSFHDSRRIRRYLGEFRPHEQESECVASTEFFPDENLSTGTLTIVFVKRGTYIYTDFPVEEWLLFNNSTSRGEYFNTYIRNNYSFERVA
jgi:hypothetical protein